MTHYREIAFMLGLGSLLAIAHKWMAVSALSYSLFACPHSIIQNLATITHYHVDDMLRHVMFVFQTHMNPGCDS